MHNTYRLTLISWVLLLLTCSTSGHANTDSALPATEKPVEEASVEWDLSDLYPDVASWEAEKDALIEGFAELDVCRGKLGNSEKILSACLDSASDMYRTLLRLYVYTFLAKDIDLGNSEYRERASMAQSLFTQFSEAVSFIDPELVEIGERKLKRFLKKSKGLKPHDFYILNTLRMSEHILSPQEESILAAASDALGTATNVYDVLTNAEIPWPTATLSDGSEVLLNSQGYAKYRAEGNRDDRKRVFVFRS